jgi:hypothetical protein
MKKSIWYHVSFSCLALRKSNYEFSFINRKKPNLKKMEVSVQLIPSSVLVSLSLNNLISQLSRSSLSVLHLKLRCYGLLSGNLISIPSSNFCSAVSGLVIVRVSASSSIWYWSSETNDHCYFKASRSS